MNPKEHVNSDFKDIIDKIKNQEEMLGSKLTGKGIRSFSQKSIMKIGVLKSLITWIDEHSEALVKSTIEDFLLDCEKYKYVINFKENNHLEEFQTSLEEHILWIRQMFLMGTVDVRFKDHVNETVLLFKVKDAYAHFFKLMLNRIKNEKESLNLGELEANMLFEYVEMLYYEYI